MTRTQARDYINARMSAELQRAPKRVTGHDTYICPICGNGGGPDGDGICTKDGKHYSCFRGCFTSLDYLDILKKQHDATESDIFRRYNLPIDGGDGGRPLDFNDVIGAAAPAVCFSPGPLRPEPPRKPLPRPQTDKSPQVFTLYHSGRRGQVSNALYPYRAEIGDRVTFADAAVYDHVAAQYRDNRRTKDGFILADCVMMDVDNDGTDNPAEWADDAAVKAAFKDVPFYVCYSKSHMIAKDGRAARPRLHVYFPVEPVRDAVEYEAVKAAMIEMFPAFDAGAKDVARFFFGVESPKTSCYPGDKNLLALLHERLQAGQPDADERPETDPPRPEPELTPEYRDPAETFEADRAAYLKTSAASYKSSFLQNITESPPPTPTGFNRLDEALGGGLYEGFYCIGAMSSLGKTTFVLQVADQMAQRGRDVLFFSLEMSRFELMAKSISRLTFKNCGSDTRSAKTTRGILNGNQWNYSPSEIELIAQSVAEYEKYAERIYIHEGVGNIGVEEIRREVQRHISFTGNRPVVVIDYLQILAPYSERATDKQNADKAVLELKRMSRDERIPVIAVSSFNRENYTTPVNFASFKESGAIEYGSDVMIGVQFAGMDELSQSDKNKADTIQKIDNMKAADPRKAELKILKNRNGRTGINLYYDFYSRYNTFEEITEPCLTVVNTR